MLLWVLWVLLVLSCADAGPARSSPGDGRPQRLLAPAVAELEPQVLLALPPVDVLVIGAGPAGLAAAHEALQAGATVTVLERSNQAGGSGREWSEGPLMLFSGSSEQAALGIPDSPEQLLAEWPTLTGGDAQDPWVQYFAHHNVDQVHDWLVALGAGFLTPGLEASGGSLPRVHALDMTGDEARQLLVDLVPAALLRTGAEARELSWDADADLEIVTWADLDGGRIITSRARTVIVATGGFMHDLDRVMAVRPDFSPGDLCYDSWEGADGNGLDLLGARGAASRNLGAVGVYAKGAPDPQGTGGYAWVPQQYEVPWVDTTGHRFTDEGELNSFRVGMDRASLPGGDAWAIFDQSLVPIDYRSPEGDVWSSAEMIAGGSVVEADSLDALATALGLSDPTGFQDELAVFNAASLGEGEDPWRSRPGTALTQAPFTAMRVSEAVAKGFGGVDVDLAGRVLDPDGAPIEHLYAAGELSGMAGGTLVGQTGFTGSMSAVLLGARVAGAAAAQDALERR